MPSHGFSTYPSGSASGNLAMKIAFSGAVEAGMKWQINDQWLIYSGVYFDYGFNNIRKIAPAAPGLLVYNEIAPTQYLYHSLTETDKISKLNLWSVGFKVRIAMKL
jgi:outer membrane receptor protein involved in Fe transport